MSDRPTTSDTPEEQLYKIKQRVSMVAIALNQRTWKETHAAAEKLAEQVQTFLEAMSEASVKEEEEAE